MILPTRIHLNSAAILSYKPGPPHRSTIASYLARVAKGTKPSASASGTLAEYPHLGHREINLRMS